MSRVLTHNAWGYRRGCRCDVCREAASIRVRDWRDRTRPRKACDVCRRVHPGRCLPGEDRTEQVTVHLPSYLRRRLDEVAPNGRSAFIRDLLRRELEA